MVLVMASASWLLNMARRLYEAALACWSCVGRSTWASATSLNLGPSKGAGRRAFLAGAALASLGASCAREEGPMQPARVERRGQPGAPARQLTPLEPLPRPTDWEVLPRDAHFGAAHTFYDVNEVLVHALRRARYFSLADWLTGTDRGRWRYYSVPGGFAIVARIEKLRPDARPDYPRFGYAEASPSLVEAVVGLLFAPPGYYRQIILVVSDRSLESMFGQQPPTPEWGQQLLLNGERTLPRDYWDDQFTQQHQVFALVYEFMKSSDTQRVEPLDHRHQIHDVRAHLAGSAILTALSE
jgi:hypothetical protein